jgi:hypothetical protein
MVIVRWFECVTNMTKQDCSALINRDQCLRQEQLTLPEIGLWHDVMSFAQQRGTSLGHSIATRCLDLRKLFAPEIPTYIVGDLHARVDRLEAVLRFENMLTKLERKEAVLVLLGDLVHPENSFASSTFEQQKKDLSSMKDSVRLLQMFYMLAQRAPGSVFKILGNHDVIDAPSGKHAQEGDRSEFIDQARLMRIQLRDTIGSKGFECLRDLEHSAPLIIAGHNYAAVHAGPLHDSKTASITFCEPTYGGFNKLNDEVQQLLWGRFCHDYDMANVRDFLGALDLAQGSLIVGHDPFDRDNWHWEFENRLRIIHGNCKKFGMLRMQDHQASYIDL